MHIIKNFSFFALFILLISCENKDSLKYDKDIILNFPVPKNDILDFSLLPYFDGQNDLVPFVSFEKKGICLLNIINGQYENVIQLENFLPDVSSLENIKLGIRFTFHNKDSVFVVLDAVPKSFFLLGNKNFKRRFDVNINYDYPYSINATKEVPILFSNKKVYIKKVPYFKEKGVDYRKKYYSVKPDLKIDIENDSISIDQFGIWPENYLSSNFYDSYPPRCLGFNNSIIYSFSASHDLFVYSEDVLKTYSAKSRFINNFFSFADDSVGNIPYIKNYYITAPRYLRTLYDKYRQLYYRIAEHEITLLNDDSTSVKTKEDKPWSLIILNKEFELIDEVLFSASSEFSPYSLMVIKDGILVKYKKQPIDNTNFTLNYALFKF